MGSNQGSILSHNLKVDLLHVHLLIKLWWKLGRFQKLLIHCGRHGSGWFSVTIELLMMKLCSKPEPVEIKTLVRAHPRRALSGLRIASGVPW
jgi:hypothetical protein